MNILIRVDSYSEIALGHLNRCINLGFSLLEYEHNLLFVCYEDETSRKRLNEVEFNFQLIPFKINDINNLDKEFKYLKSVSQTIDLLIVDSYSVNDNYFRMLSNIFSKIVYLDDLGFDVDVDMVINPSCKVEKSDYMAKDVLSGIDYVILGPEYSVGRLDKIDLMKDSILITMGGIDHYNLSSRVIAIIEEISTNIEVNLLIGPYYENIDLIKNSIIDSNLKINILEDISNISSIILKNNMAITAGGFTVYEMAAMSTPCIGIALWDNQSNNIECMSKKHALLPLYYSSEYEFDRHLKKELIKLISNTNLRLEMSRRARIVVDGNGADRISKAITKKYSTKFNCSLR